MFIELVNKRSQRILVNVKHIQAVFPPLTPKDNTTIVFSDGEEYDVLNNFDNIRSAIVRVHSVIVPLNTPKDPQT